MDKREVEILIQEAVDYPILLRVALQLWRAGWTYESFHQEFAKHPKADTAAVGDILAYLQDFGRGQIPVGRMNNSRSQSIKGKRMELIVILMSKRC